MTLETNCAFLENELLDVARLFKARPQTVSHAFRFQAGVFFNDFTVDGVSYRFEDVGQVCDELEYKRQERRFAKLRLYEILSAKYCQQMPWGALTGIRPTKLAYGELEKGGDYKALFQKMYVSEKNIQLVEEILKAQQGLYEKNDDYFDLFVSLPFCPTKCAYCSFITAPIEKTKAFLPSYINCLEQELSACLPLVKSLRSVYIGGGTPFALEGKDLESVLKAVVPFTDKYAGVEYTVEAGRPDVFSEEKLRLLKEYGVTRICINPQTFCDATLEKIGRKHTVADFYRAQEMSEKYGFSVNIDLIAGLVDETPAVFEESVTRAIALSPDNITVHCLSLKSGAKLKEEISYIENDAVSDMIEISRRLLFESGYKPYYMYRQKYQAGNNENVGWTKAGKACVYNVDVMEETANNLAVGANAVSKRVRNAESRIERCASQKDLRTYIENISKIIAEKVEFFK